MSPGATMKRWTTLIFLTGFLLSLLTPTFSAEVPLKVINVAVPAVSLLHAPLLVAIDAGAFRKYRMAVRYIVTSALTIPALIGDSVPFGQGGYSPTVPAEVLG